MPKEIDARLSERIRQAVDEGFEEQVAFTADLVRENAFLLCKALRDLEAQWNDERSTGLRAATQRCQDFAIVLALDEQRTGWHHDIAIYEVH